MKTTIKYTKNLSNFDTNKIPIEQQICLLKANDSVKEKAILKHETQKPERFVKSIMFVFYKTFDKSTEAIFSTGIGA